MRTTPPFQDSEQVGTAAREARALAALTVQFEHADMLQAQRTRQEWHTGQERGLCARVLAVQACAQAQKHQARAERIWQKRHLQQQEAARGDCEIPACMSE